MGKRLDINLGQDSYSIWIQNNLLEEVARLIRLVYNGEKIFILTDENVGALYAERIKTSLHKDGFTVRCMQLTPGETTKSFSTLPSIYRELLDFKLTRKELIIALGGGVVGDIAGFVASTYLRGVPYVQIPTSLLAQVDSSVGGKVAVDLDEGKNLVGSFYQPKAVLIDPLVLKTLPDRYFRDGMAEVIKYGCISDKVLFDRIKMLKSREKIMGQIENIIYTCCSIKKYVVEIDQRDNRERMLLNFGHTLGHAIEKKQQYTGYSHGEAVAIGMYNITRISEAAGLTKAGTAEQIAEILSDIGLPNKVKLDDPKELFEAVALDKKNCGRILKVVLLEKIGKAMLYDTTIKFFEPVNTWEI